MSNFRQQAILGLLELYQDKPLPNDFTTWDPNSKNLLLQTCRYYFRLETMALFLADQKKPKDDFVWCALITGLCELHSLQNSVHAVIFETVNIIKKSRYRSASGFLNALLRKSIREKKSWEEKLSKQEEFVYAHPNWFIEHIKKSWPDNWQDILNANNQHPPMTLRVNRKVTPREDYQKKLQVPSKSSDNSPQAIILNKPCSVDDLPGFWDGVVSIQDEAAQLAGRFLNLEPNLKILDACAAPGGKTGHILELEPTTEIIAIELQEHRFKKLEETLKRLHLHGKCLLADACAPQNWWDQQLFDRILIDAPCSGTGVIRRHPDIKLRRSPENIFINTPIQQKLLHELWPLLKKNGFLLYITCSILPEENHNQIKIFLEQLSNAKIIPLEFPEGFKNEYGLQIFPGQQNMDGFFYSLIQKI